VLATLVAGATLSLGSLVGLLALLGIAVRNGLLLLTHFQRLQRGQGQEFGAEMVEGGAKDRLVPSLTTAASLAVLLMPFVVLGDAPGLEVVHPMAVAVIGGLVTSTLLSLFVLPSLYLRFGAPEPHVRPEDELMHGWEEAHPVTAGGGRAGGSGIRPADGPPAAA
jgi:Cu/Ag efflux pump CusA